MKMPRQFLEDQLGKRKTCFFNNNQMWLVRDQDGALALSLDEPEKVEMDNGEGFWIGDTCTELDPNLFPEVKWEDEHPRKVKLVLEEA